MTTPRHGTDHTTATLPYGVLYPAAPRRPRTPGGPRGDAPGPLQEIRRVVARTLQGIRPAPRAIAVISSTLPGGYPGGMGRGCHLATPLRALDEWRPICRYCRRRPREFKGLDDWSRERRFRVLCAPCLRELRSRWQGGVIPPPAWFDPRAPKCPACCDRARWSKGTRRGKRRYYRFCGPCYRAAREALGLPAYRGARGVRLWLRLRLRRGACLPHHGRRPRWGLPPDSGAIAGQTLPHPRACSMDGCPGAAGSGAPRGGREAARPSLRLTAAGASA